MVVGDNPLPPSESLALVVCGDVGSYGVYNPGLGGVIRIRVLMDLSPVKSAPFGIDEGRLVTMARD